MCSLFTQLRFEISDETKEKEGIITEVYIVSLELEGAKVAVHHLPTPRGRIYYHCALLSVCTPIQLLGVLWNHTMLIKIHCRTVTVIRLLETKEKNHSGTLVHSSNTTLFASAKTTVYRSLVSISYIVPECIKGQLDHTGAYISDCKFSQDPSLWAWAG